MYIKIKGKWNCGQKAFNQKGIRNISVNPH